MDFSGIDIAAVGGAIGALVKSFMTGSQNKATKISMETNFALMKQRQEEFESRLRETDSKAAEQENKMDRMGERISTIATDVSFIRGILEGRGKK